MSPDVAKRPLLENPLFSVADFILLKCELQNGYLPPPSQTPTMSISSPLPSGSVLSGLLFGHKQQESVDSSKYRMNRVTKRPSGQSSPLRH